MMLDIQIIIWTITLCSSADGYQRFGETCYPRLYDNYLA